MQGQTFEYFFDHAPFLETVACLYRQFNGEIPFKYCIILILSYKYTVYY